MHRALVFLAVGGGAFVLVPHGAVTTGERSGDVPPLVRFDSVEVLEPHFSPNADGVLDSTRLRYTLVELTRLTIHVSPAGSSDTLAVLVCNKTPDPRLTSHTVIWNGRYRPCCCGSTRCTCDPQGEYIGPLQPEGRYTVTFSGTGLQSNRSYYNQRQVWLDLTSPRIDILGVEPEVYTPTLPESVTVIPKVRVRVSRAQFDDEIGVVLIDKRGVTRDTLQASGGFSGDGDYVAVCIPCTQPPPDSLGDGVYNLQAFARDRAGNRTTAVGSLDKDIRGPRITVSHPRPPRAVQYADSLVGMSKDRHMVVLMEMDVTGTAGGGRVSLLPRAPPDTTYRFLQDLSELLAEEGTYGLLLRAFDEHGVRDSLAITLEVDRTRPPSPGLVPPLPATTKSQTITGKVRVDSTTVRLVVTGGAEDPDTLAVLTTEKSFQRQLLPGSNQLAFKAIDKAGNVSTPEIATIVWETSVGLAVPERFNPGQRIEIDAGDTPADAVVVRILAVDGSLVRTFEDQSNQLVYSFEWDLRTPEGRSVKNGAYLVQARVRYPNGAESRFRQMIAVLQ